ncbi:ABC transporter ATP-binding protein/permease [Brachybacterium muris]|uniref:ABC transporter transmembrane domain-containing protein n=1 Tax=Brachybacterium muris TaxID=219301 RepID=UPI00195EC73D|nr:ATP-binding cassette subfamily B protein [Brachybacterium muris]MCT1430450.1 ABC transporter ATP-binding protein/permease [Brachybacterium muris]MCT1996764.1 ABC transporter ATP-binding protein/permease [Brachybacterium muris]MCT2295656.1 ABC transporter ATP-binding protein/permease [Brachybacterium muris]
MPLLRLVLRALKPYLPWVLLVVLFQTIGVMAALYLPTINADIIDDGVAKADIPVIWRLGWIMTAVSFGNIVALVLANYFSARSAMSVGRDLRTRVFGQVQSFSPREISEFGTPSLITRSTNDVQQVQLLIFFSLNFLVQAPVTGIGGVILALSVEPGMAWLIAVMVPVMLVSVGFLILKAAPMFRQMQEKIDRINGVLREQITGIRVLRAFVREERERERYEEVNFELTDLNRRIGLLMILINPIIMFIINVSSVLVLAVAAPRIDAGQMEIGSITAFIAYLIQILIAVMMATFMTMMIPRAMVSAERITAVLSTDTSVVQRTNGVRDVEGPVELTFEDVSFTYPGAEKSVLEDISFTARAGQTVAIIGGTGAGKTSLLNLVPRLVDVTEGRVLLNGHDVRDLDAQVLWDRVGLVPQRPYLFSGTVGSNLRFGNPDATDEELWQALTIAQGRDFVAAMPLQLDSPIAQGGTNVSGGQRQRLCIARALVAKPSLFLFDDSFSALDLTTDAKLRRALAPHTRDALVLVVAQRVTTITGADLILVLDHGRIVGRGTHAELLESSETYREIVRSQGVEEEAA